MISSLDSSSKLNETAFSSLRIFMFSFNALFTYSSVLSLVSRTTVSKKSSCLILKPASKAKFANFDAYRLTFMAIFLRPFGPCQTP